ncbi:FAD-dependent oxidoreductase [Paenibacillus koleovorans]|uniref:FAD-dependent oxidoreductase n=1 Tax=Paenibacillus koleovorans TaxID=121608 RepID=UPI0024822D1B|nr:FAD-dependent oxidoreductase [Paenibacillus koleovorans]
MVGASFGGVSAALSAVKMGKRVILTEETGWIGGQATGQGVPLDEHPWIENFGHTRSYLTFRSKVRDYYRRNYPMNEKARQDLTLNPGACWVSALGFEPRVGEAVLEEMLAPYRSAGLLSIFKRLTPVKAMITGDIIHALEFQSIDGENVTIAAQYVLDATELGDLLPMCGVEHVIGAESISQTGEPLAVEGDAQPLRQQPFTHLIALSHHPENDFTIPKPLSYEKFRPKFAHITATTERSGAMAGLFANNDEEVYRQSIWNFRRHFCRDNFDQTLFTSDLTVLMNGNEYRDGVLAGVSQTEKLTALKEAKELSRSLVYYLQSELGFKGLLPRSDVFDTSDGLAAHPYIRESRRIKAEFTICEQDFRIDMHPDGPVDYADSVGVSGYRIDIHEKGRDGGPNITTAVHGKHWVQQISLGALIPVRLQNLIPACKNIGTTHVTNGSFRVHSTEWNIGEAAGALAAYCLKTGESPRAVRNTNTMLEDFQFHLDRLGIERGWPRLSNSYSYASYAGKRKNWYFGEAKRL